MQLSVIKSLVQYHQTLGWDEIMRTRTRFLQQGQISGSCIGTAVHSQLLAGLAQQLGSARLNESMVTAQLSLGSQLGQLRAAQLWLGSAPRAATTLSLMIRSALHARGFLGIGRCVLLGINSPRSHRTAAGLCIGKGEAGDNVFNVQQL
jgi:hypothetical protein